MTPPRPLRPPLALLGLLLLGACQGTAADTESTPVSPWPDDFHRGMALGLYHADPEFSYTERIEEIAALGADSISLVVVWMQTDVRANEIRVVEGRTVPDARLAEAIRTAKSLGLHVLVFPIVLLEQAGEGEWRGRLNPADLDAWCDSYRARLTTLARLAEREGADALSLGSEFSSLEQHTGRWRDTIAAVRAEFSGDMLYSANWDHLAAVQFWDALDFAGVSCYFVLAETPDVPEDWLDGAWRVHRDAILEWHAGAGLEVPLMVTEVGYASQDGIAQHPWDYTLHSGVDLEEQRRCYAAFIRMWDSVDTLRGVYFYEWGTGEGGAGDDTYTPRGKPAEQLIADWYRHRVVPVIASPESGER